MEIATIPDLPEDDPSFGPCMRALSPMQRKFVLATQVVGPGEGQHAQAARMAGYAKTGGADRVTAHRLAHDPRVQAAILEEAGKRLGSRADWVMMQIIDVAENTGDQKLRLKALLSLADRCGLTPVTKHQVQVTHELGPQAMLLARIKEQVRRNPQFIALLPAPLQAVIKPPETVDAEFVEIKSDEAVKADLEDFLK